MYYIILYNTYTQILNVTYYNILMSILQVNKMQMCTHSHTVSPKSSSNFKPKTICYILMFSLIYL